eukprot:5787984-Pleurochrysis_carterae.AAC.12
MRARSHHEDEQLLAQVAIAAPHVKEELCRCQFRRAPVRAQAALRVGVGADDGAAERLGPRRACAHRLRAVRLRKDDERRLGRGVGDEVAHEHLEHLHAEGAHGGQLRLRAADGARHADGKGGLHGRVVRRLQLVDPLVREEHQPIGVAGRRAVEHTVRVRRDVRLRVRIGVALLAPAHRHVSACVCGLHACGWCEHHSAPVYVPRRVI